jgi:uncharacterized protein YndB with AHSA1/START domain
MAAGTDFTITRAFNAPRTKVWAAWTERARLMQWFGPKGFTIPVCNLELREGGSFHYCMRNDDGFDMWGKWVFREIFAPERLVWVQSFSDARGGVARSPFGGEWPPEILSTITLTEATGKTILTVRQSPLNATEAELQAFADMRASMNLGWGGTLDKLAEFLAKG